MSNPFETQLRASYNGVEFIMSAHQQTFGRDTVVHNLPFSSNAPRYVEDLGMAADEYRFIAEVNNSFPYKGRYEFAKFAFYNVFKRFPFGFLIHTFSGARISVAQIEKPVLIEDNEQAGVAKFRVALSDTTSALFPSVVVSTVSSITSAIPAVTQALHG